MTSDRAWILTPEEYEATAAKLDKINQRAQRRGFTGNLVLDGQRDTRTYTNAAGFEVEEVIYRAHVTGDAPRYGGWTFLATLDHDPHAGLIVRTVPGVDDAVDRSGIREDACDHCGSRRHRKNTYLVRHDDGTQMQVGSSCIKDFLGWDTLPVFLSDAAVRASLEDTLGDGFARTFTTETLLACAWAVIKHHGGYVPTSSPGCTRDAVAMLLDPPSGSWHATQAALEFRPYIEHATEMGRTIREFLLSDAFTGTGDYAQNLRTIAAADAVSPRNFGLLVSAPQAWIRHHDYILREQRDRDEIRNEWYGTPGDKIDITVTVRNVSWSSSQWGVSTIYTLLSDDGYQFKWFASKEALGDKPSPNPVRLRGTVKSHDEWKDRKETRLTRCSVQPPTSPQQ